MESTKVVSQQKKFQICRDGRNCRQRECNLVHICPSLTHCKISKCNLIHDINGKRSDPKKRLEKLSKPKFHHYPKKIYCSLKNEVQGLNATETNSDTHKSTSKQKNTTHNHDKRLKDTAAICVFFWMMLHKVKGHEIKKE